MSITYLAKSLFDGQQIRQNVFITIEDGKIASLSLAHTDSHVVTLDGLLTAGFVDVQVNGGGGVLFNNSPTATALARMSAAHIKYGTTSMLPTVITDDLSVMTKAANAISESIANRVAAIKGVHFEGPHLSGLKKGIHPVQHIRSVSDAELDLFCRQDLGKVVVTVAPENVPPDVIKELVKNGVIVCLGHSNADAETVFIAIDAGATGFTHLFNAMSPLTGRECGMVGSALLDEHSFCGLIVDHHHVHALSCKLAIKTKGYKKIMLVTDAMAQVGSAQHTLEYFDTVITRQGSKLTLPDGTLAGSALDMASAVRNCHDDLGIPLTEALSMAAQTPAHFLGLADTIGQLIPGQQADMVLLDGQLQVCSTWINGQEYNPGERP